MAAWIAALGDIGRWMVWALAALTNSAMANTTNSTTNAPMAATRKPCAGVVVVVVVAVLVRDNTAATTIASSKGKGQQEPKGSGAWATRRASTRCCSPAPALVCPDCSENCLSNDIANASCALGSFGAW